MREFVFRYDSNREVILVIRTYFVSTRLEDIEILLNSYGTVLFSDLFTDNNSFQFGHGFFFWVGEGGKMAILYIFIN